MNKLAIAVAALLIIVGFVGYNVWHAVYDPVSTPPSLVDQGRQQLHNQLEQSKSREAEIEKQDWNSISLLRGLIQAHQHRIDQLKDNSQAGEIIAWDHDSIGRIEKRIVDLEAQQAAQPSASADQEAGSSATSPAPSGQPQQEPTLQKPQPAGTASKPGVKSPSASASRPAQKPQPAPRSAKAPQTQPQ